jgi:hypothetical protein
VGVVGNRVSRLTGAGYILQAIAPGPAVTLAGQPIGSSVTYAIAAVDLAGNVSTALTTTVNVPAPPPPPPAAASPASSFVATVTSTKVSLSWQQPGSGTTGWRIVEFRGGTVASTREVTTPNATFGPYAPNTSVRFELYSLLGGAVSTAVTLDARTAADTAKPTKPGRVKATSPARGALAVTWVRSRDDIKLRGYELRLTTRGAKAKVVKLRGTAVRTKVVRLKRRAAYTVQLRAVDAAGNASAWVTVRARTR